MLTVDLNADMGEGMATDHLLMPWISSANIACGGHAGDRESMLRTVELARRHGVAIGAHPSYPDRKNFGRADILGSTITMKDIRSIIMEQVQSLAEICREMAVTLRHVKPHGALYNRAARDAELSAIITEAVRDCDTSLIIYGLSGSLMSKVVTSAGLNFVHEVFADRTYQSDGSLTPRSHPAALITDQHQSLQQVLLMLKEGRVRTINGTEIPIQAESICIHGDGPHAAGFAQIIRQTLESADIQIKSPVG